MLLAIDVGNTETTLALFHDGEVEESWRIATVQSRTADELGLLLRALLRLQPGAQSRVTAAVIGSVVPSLTAPLLHACGRWLDIKAVSVDAASPLPIKLDVHEPLTVGADRIINTLAASRIYARDTIVVDLGTATTFDCITRDGVFLGGVIAPGVQVSAETLYRRTSKLPAPDLVQPDRAIGKRTEDCIRAGVVFGAADSIDGIVRRIRAEWPTSDRPLAVATGGLAGAIARHCSEVDEVDPLLTLRGLQIAFSFLRDK